MQATKGLHHITAVASDPQTNVDFYQNILGQRLIKTTVNFDDPSTYHFYFGDQQGSPGTILTFFPWQHLGLGRIGVGETAGVAYTIRPDSLGFWQNHLKSQGIDVADIETRFDSEVLRFYDPDGMPLELVSSTTPPSIRYWEGGPIPEAHALLGFHSVTLWLAEIERTSDLLTEMMGYEFIRQEGDRYRFRAASGAAGATLDIVHRPGYPRGRFGAGSIHHIAFRTKDDQAQSEYLAQLRQYGQRVTPVKDRQYFHSIYFRSPGGVLFEIATDNPGFSIDEQPSELGSSLKLPPWLEPNRLEIESDLPFIERKPQQKVVLAEVSGD